MGGHIHGLSVGCKRMQYKESEFCGVLEGSSLLQEADDCWTASGLSIGGREAVEGREKVLLSCL